MRVNNRACRFSSRYASSAACQASAETLAESTRIAASVNFSIHVLDAADAVVGYLLRRDCTGHLAGPRAARPSPPTCSAGGILPWWGVLLSIVATETSTVTFLSIPGLAFVPRPAATCGSLQLTLGYILGRFWWSSVSSAALLPRRAVHRLRGPRPPVRPATKQAASLLFLVTRNLADGLRLYLTAIVHCSTSWGWTSGRRVIVMGAITILYTFWAA